MALWPFAAAILLAMFLWGSGSFRFVEASLLFASCACAYFCVRQHYGKHRPESMLIVIAAIIFLIAYVAQAILFLKISRNTVTTLGDALSVRSIFSAAALGAQAGEIQVSLQVVLVGFIGVLLPSLYLAYGSTKRKTNSAAAPPDLKLVIANPVTLGYAALVCIVFFGFLRKIFGLESPTATGLPMGIGGLINIASAYIGPNLSFAAFFFALQQGADAKSKKMALLCVLLGVVNYVLFTSKLSIIFPVLFILISQHLLKRRVVSMRTLIILGSVFVLIYPFLNLYRSAIALGIAPGDLIAAITKMYVNQREASDIDQSVLQVGISAILGRFVGYDPLMILLQARPYPGSLIDYLLNGNLDKFLTYDILDFQDPMGYSPGFMGRFYYVSRSYLYLLAMTSGIVWMLAAMIKRFWNGNVRMQFMAPLLLTYSLIFFTDGLRVELLRSLFFSSLFIYGFIRFCGKLRVVRAN